MARGRWQARLRRWLRRPSLFELCLVSLGLHGALLLLGSRLGLPAPPPVPLSPLVVELPEAAPGHPLVRPEAGAPLTLRRPASGPSRATPPTAAPVAPPAAAFPTPPSPPPPGPVAGDRPGGPAAVTAPEPPGPSPAPPEPSRSPIRPPVAAAPAVPDTPPAPAPGASPPTFPTAPPPAPPAAPEPLPVVAARPAPRAGLEASLEPPRPLARSEPAREPERLLSRLPDEPERGAASRTEPLARAPSSPSRPARRAPHAPEPSPAAPVPPPGPPAVSSPPALATQPAGPPTRPGPAEPAGPTVARVPEPGATPSAPSRTAAPAPEAAPIPRGPARGASEVGPKAPDGGSHPQVAPSPPAPPAAGPGPVAPAVAARPPEPAPAAPRPGVGTGPGERAQGAAPVPEGPRESPLAGRQFSLLAPRLEVPPLPVLPRGGGTAREGEGAGGRGRELEGQPVIPLNTPDPRYSEYFLEVKRQIERVLVYPQEAARRGQAGQLVLDFVIRKDGSVQVVELVRSSGVRVLDTYSLNAIRLAAPFPPIPERLGLDQVAVEAIFTYVLEGYRIFGFR